ncbi:unnamed protein product [Cylindrotheca closterium]|uniref:ADP-ribosylation factor-like protein 6-interacting protein 4 n=1 Tax=Cylindrotheca closterium TaxID=2856 RepID=A0AAD2JKU2_9STRA|nr:unnamed protein product [Cylindrotheca closterium]
MPSPSHPDNNEDVSQKPAVKRDDDDTSFERDARSRSRKSSSSHRRDDNKERKHNKKRRRHSKETRKRKRRKHYSSSSSDDDSSSPCSSSDDDSSSYHRRDRNRKKDRHKKRRKRSSSSSKRRRRDREGDSKDRSVVSDSKVKEWKEGNLEPMHAPSKVAAEVPPPVVDQQAPQKDDTPKRKAMMVPMSKAEYDKQQSQVRQVYDPETGRVRLVKGTGEIIESIVSRADHQRINQQATRGDGASFARSTLTVAAKQRNYYQR